MSSEANFIETDIREEANISKKPFQQSSQPSANVNAAAQQPKRSTEQTTQPPSHCRFCSEWHFHNQCKRNLYLNQNSSRRPNFTGVIPKTSKQSSNIQDQAAALPLPFNASENQRRIGQEPVHSRSFPLERLDSQLHNEYYDILYEFSHLFDESSDQPITRTVNHDIRVTSTTVVKVKPYPLSERKKKILNEQIDEMLSSGVIEPSISPYSSSPTHLANSEETIALVAASINCETTAPVESREKFITWLGDSGARDHMVNNECYFSTVSDLENGIQISVAKSDDSLKATKIGNISVKLDNDNGFVGIKDVLYIKNLSVLIYKNLKLLAKEVMAGLSDKDLECLVNEVAIELETITDEQAMDSDIGGDPDAEDCNLQQKKRTTGLH
ncbi:hypothetical protein NQ314_007678 [Rhamnusium bicolor]|uniref:Retrovirus-related Pol polyprotein from transposon TNT 1-94-like beta-barrel domain-containing protein n=1 Tax=Rhamnusium bicolor TaxID=1586634 RepID=A0AAV8YK93_9CUCU|nr:hypothetical protein NQ314_007678 [Rhamnusium bicolor]